MVVGPRCFSKIRVSVGRKLAKLADVSCHNVKVGIALRGCPGTIGSIWQSHLRVFCVLAFSFDAPVVGVDSSEALVATFIT